MGLYLGDKQISKLYVGDKEIVKAYLGDKIVYQPDNEPILFTRQEGHNLVINTNYPIPTRIYNMDTSESSETTTYLSLPLEIGNLTQSSYSDNYYYQPDLYSSPTFVSIPGYKQYPATGDLYSANLAEVMLGYTPYVNSQTYFSKNAYIHTFGSSPNYYLQGTYQIDLSSSSGMIADIYIDIRNYFNGRDYPPFFALDYALYKVEDTQGNTLYEVTTTTAKIDASSNPIWLRNIKIPNDGQLVVTIKYQLKDGGNPQYVSNLMVVGGNSYVMVKGSLYNTPLYCNISRTILTSEEHPEYNEDTVEVMIRSTDTNSLKMVSLSEDGVAVITNKENGGN